MARNLSLLTHLPRLEADGITHRRDCECVRCDAGFRPTEHERAAARRRWQERQVREAAARALARREERARVRATAIEIQLGGEVRAANDQIGALRAAHARVDGDQRLALLQALRRGGMSLGAALLEVERRCGGDGDVAQQGLATRRVDYRSLGGDPTPITGPTRSG